MTSEAGAAPRRGRRLEHRDRRSVAPEPGPIERGGGVLHGGASGHHDHRGGRRDVRPPDRQAGSARVRSGHFEQRTRRPAGRSDRARRRVRAVDRPEGRCVDPVERLLPGVPCRLRVAVRRRPPDRWQARPARRLGVRESLAGTRPGEPQGHPGRQAARRNEARRSEGGRRQRQPAGQRTDARAEGAAAAEGGERCGITVGHAGRPRASAVRCIGADTSRRRGGQRADAVPRVRGAPSDRHERERHRRRVLVARRVHLDRDRRRAWLHPVAPHVQSAAAERPQGDADRRGRHRRGGQLRGRPPKHRLRDAGHGGPRAGRHRSSRHRTGRTAQARQARPGAEGRGDAGRRNPSSRSHPLRCQNRSSLRRGCRHRPTCR